MQYLLTGQAPFGGGNGDGNSSISTTDMIRAHRSVDPPKIQFHHDDANATERHAVQQLVSRMLAKHPADRPDSMRSIADTLQPHIANAHLGEAIAKLTPNAMKERGTATGQTIQLTDLVASTAMASRPRLWITVASVAVVMLLVGSVLFQKWWPRQSASVASVIFDAKRQRSSTVPATISEFIETWQFEPRKNARYLGESTALLKKHQGLDPSVVAVGIKATSPRHLPVAIQWSPTGERLAILTMMNELRIYRWRDSRLSLESATRADHYIDWFRHICWHPDNRTLVVASANFIMTATPARDGSLKFDILPLDVGTIESVDSLKVGDRGLIVITTPDSILGWDPSTGQIEHGLGKRGSRLFVSAVADTRYLVRTDIAIEVWRAKLQSPQNDPTSKSRSTWKFSLEQSRDVRQANGILDLQVNRDASQVLIVRSGMAMLRRVDDLERINSLPASTQFATQLFELSPTSNDQLTSIFVATDGLIDRWSTEPSLADIPFKRLSTEGVGHSLQQARFAGHPFEPIVAVVYPGGVEVWNNNLETIDRLPGMDYIEKVEPLQLQDGRVAFRRDGSGITFDSSGRFIGDPLPPVNVNLKGTAAVTMNQVLPESLEVIQANDRGATNPQRRSLLDFGIESNPRDDRLAVGFDLKRLRQPGTDEQRQREQQQSPDRSEAREDLSDQRLLAIRPRASGDEKQPNPLRFKPSLAERWYRVAFVPDTNRLALCDTRGSYQIGDVGIRNDRMVSTGQVDGIGSHLCTAINADGITLYFSGHDSRGVHVASVDVETGNQNWSITTDDIDGESKLVALRDGSLLLTNWSGWLQLDAASGEVLRNVTPRTRYGFRHHWSRLDPFNGGVISWQRAPIVEPAAFWSPSLELESLLFATDCHSWISLSADG